MATTQTTLLENLNLKKTEANGNLGPELDRHTKVVAINTSY
jgi:hypothetical protein